MYWNFWNKIKATEEPPMAKQEKLPKPKDIPEPVGRYLVVDLRKDPDWVWQLKSVVRRREEKHCYDVRVFDDAQAAAKKVRIKDYSSLDEHPELILFEGWYDKKSMTAHVEERLELTSKAA